MAKMDIILHDKTEEKFRRTVAYVKCLKKGNVSEALEEAIDLGIMEQARKRKGDNE